ncbi:MAG: YveK family protein [Chloroflexota bacterium]
MEFREYWQVIWRRRQVIVPLVVVTFIASALFNLVLPPIYTTSTTVQVIPVIPPPAPGTTEYFSQEYYRTLYSEYISDDLSEIVKSESFAARVADQIETRYGREVGVQDIMEAVSKTKRVHRTLKITVATGSEAMSRMITEAMDEVLRTEGWQYFSRDERQPVQINILNPPSDPTAPGLLRRLIEVMLHSAIALVVGIGLAFLLHYLDDRIVDEEDAVRTLGWRALGGVPADGAGGATPATNPVPALTGLLPRGWRKTPTTLAVLIGIASLAAVSTLAAWYVAGM